MRKEPAARAAVSLLQSGKDSIQPNSEREGPYCRRAPASVDKYPVALLSDAVDLLESGKDSIQLNSEREGSVL